MPAPAYFPLRLRCARALNRLGEATGTFIPVAPILLEVRQWSDLRRSPKPGQGQQPDVLLQLRVTKGSMRSAQYQQEVVSQVGGYCWVVGALFGGGASVRGAARWEGAVLLCLFCHSHSSLAPHLTPAP